MTDTNDLVRKRRDPSVFLVSRKDTADYIEELEAELKEQAMQYLSDTGQLGERIGELTEVLGAVDAWVEDLGYYADEGAELAPVFKKVKAVLGRGYK